MRIAGNNCRESAAGGESSPRLLRYGCVALLLAVWVAAAGTAAAQDADSSTWERVVPAVVQPGPDAVEGVVLNRVTREPIARALVFSGDDRYAVLTDDRGHFEFKFPPQQAIPSPPAEGSTPQYLERMNQWYAQNARPIIFFAKRPDFLRDTTGVQVPAVRGESAHIVLTLEPEALLTGHVEIRGVDTTDRIRVALYRQGFQDGRQRWGDVKQFTTWADGNFRFPELSAGTYKLLTLEQMERDSASFNAKNQVYGFPPVFFSNAGDFESAAPIQIAAGARVEANITLARKPYYPVKIAVRNPPATRAVGVSVYPLNHPGPGYSLGYDSAEQAIVGSLPDGGYTLRVYELAVPGLSGTANFTVEGGRSESAAITLVPNSSLTVNVIRELSSSSTPTTAEPSGDDDEPTPGGPAVQVSLQPAEPFFDQAGTPEAARAEASVDHLTINNVAPGSYWLDVSADNGYVASAFWGGADVLRHPLTVGPETTSVPIEVKVRNDGAEVSGKVTLNGKEGQPSAGTEASSAARPVFVYLVPLDDAGQYTQGQAEEGTFEIGQVPPGTYRVLAFDKEKSELGRGNPGAADRYDSQGMVVELAPHQVLALPTPLTVVNEP